MRQKFIDEGKKIREHHMAEADAERRHRRRLRAIADKMDLFGPDCLSREEQGLVDRHKSYFERREKDREFWQPNKTKAASCRRQAKRRGAHK